LLHQLRNRNFYIMILGDAFLFCISLIGAYLIRFDFYFSCENLSQALKLMPFIVLIKSATYFSFGLYRGMWRYSSISDMWKLCWATLFSSLLIVSAILYICHFKGYSRGVFFIDGLLTLFLTGSFRLSIRLLYSKGLILKEKFFTPLNKTKRVIIVGAGDAGEMVLRDIQNNPYSSYDVVGFVDDDPAKRGRTIHGVKVLGSVDELPEFVQEMDIDEVLVAIPTATGKQMKRIINICEKCGVPYKTLPGIVELIDGKATVKRFRDVSYEDLLRRKPVKLDTQAISKYVNGKTILVTGAGGSIGSELCRQLTRFSPAKLILLDASEANLYEIQTELMYRFGFKDIAPVLGNVQYRPVVESVMNEYKPELIIHAAAYKHVPMMEMYPWEAVFNNIVGSRNVMNAAVKFGAKRFIMVSTDKAVRPTNVMGASKRVCELIMQSLNGENGTKMMCVRFGNVIGSSGSVIPLFKKQIEYGGPVTITHPEVTRYFMTIPEACQLILQAGALGKGGEVFILEMGEPVKIKDIAEELIRLSGKEPGRDIEMVFIGLRPGEKLYEELITEGEGIVRTEHKKIYVLHTNNNWYGHGSKQAFRRWLDSKLKDLVKAAEMHDTEMIKTILKKLVPEYNPKLH